MTLKASKKINYLEYKTFKKKIYNIKPGLNEVQTALIFLRAN